MAPAAVHLARSTQVAEVTLDEVVAQLKKDPGRPVRARVGELTIEVRAVNEQEPARSAADVFAELGPWAGESTEEILRLLADARREENLARIAALKRAVAVLPLSDRVADLYGENRAALETSRAENWLE